MDSPTIYNMPPEPPTWDAVGIFYIAFCSTWTLLVIIGMAFCLHNRRHPILKLRPLPLSFLAIGMLHSYWILAQLVYPISRTMPTVIAFDVQYFVMGTYFPLGVAFFHASNTRFLHIARLQRQFTHPSRKPVRERGCNGARTSWLCRLRNTTALTRIMVAIGIGIVFQILLTVSMWVACAKYHPTFGIPGTEIKGATFPEQMVDLGRGWEWWPSLAWQLAWAWIFAPVLLCRAWGIRDTLGWRTQTVGCCLSSLHAAPMFLIASYVPAFAPVNAYFAPSQWIHLSTMIWEIFTVVLPATQIIRAKFIKRTNGRWTNPEWEGTSQSAINLQTFETKSGASHGVRNSSSHRLNTMGALERVLEENPSPLQEFSALSDFSGENIAFLTRMAAWKANFDLEDMRRSFNEALEVYVDFVSPRDAQFPLNLPSHDLKALERIFEGPARTVCGEADGNMAAPFASSEQESHGSHDHLAMEYLGDIPVEFSNTIFDNAQHHVKYLVLTNTWPRFVANQERRRSTDTDRTRVTTGSGMTRVSQISSKIIRILTLRL